MEKIYSLNNNIININDISNFNATHILECGQIFRYNKLNENCYIVFSKNEFAKITKINDTYQIESSNPNYFVNFFDLNTNYSQIIYKLSTHKVLIPMLNAASGIRILKQDPIEMIISFIISANNNIKRIQAIINRMCEKYGKLITFNGFSYHAFPTLNELQQISIEDFKNLGAGYRAKYLFNAIKQLQTFNLNEIYALNSENASKKLQTLSGVGPKVCDCILLFAFNKQDCFPVDTWIKKVYNSYFSETFEDNPAVIRKNLVHIFKNYSGYAQQYLFYYKRTLEKTENLN